VYRSKQRGFLELDLVLGTWVEQHIRSMDEANIRSLLQVLDLVSYPPPPLIASYVLWFAGTCFRFLELVRPDFPAFSTSIVHAKRNILLLYPLQISGDHS
jgi:hypothetical protein